MTTCRHCAATWTGLRICHCSVCHRTFSSPSTFDKHQSAKYVDGAAYQRTAKDGTVTTHHRKVEVRPSGECYDPAGDGMVRNDRGQWSMPNDGYDFAGRAAS